MGSAAKSKQAQFMERHKDKPWVDNYPPLAEFLRERKARCDWQLPLGNKDEPVGYVEQWRFPNGRICIVTVHARQGGWDIATPCTTDNIIATLADVDARCALEGK